MNSYFSMSKNQLEEEKNRLSIKYKAFKDRGLKLDMSRGKPGKDQLDLSNGLLDVLDSNSDFKTENGFDCRNYGLSDGIPEIKELMGKMLGVDASMVLIGGNSSLNLMFDTIACFMYSGVNGCKPWGKQENIKFLCPVPGYDRHFSITEYFGIDMINIPMTDKGPDMDLIEKLVLSDETIKGIWCVPKYSNPQGITYSDDTVRRFSRLRAKAPDFRIMWDNAYCVHDVTDTPDSLLNLMDECIKNGNEDMPILFCSTSKVTYPGAGIAAMAASKNNMSVLKERFKYQTIGFDKLNMLRHIRFLKDYDGVLEHMKKHKAILKPRFDVVINALERELLPLKAISFNKPNGGYFISVDVADGCAKRVATLCKNAGVTLTDAGATYPYGKDTNDSNIRIAPTYPPLDELKAAMELFCISVRLATVEKLLNQP